MKVIKLKTVHYVSKEGITLTMENPYVEATEDNVKKMEYFLKEGYLEIIDLDKKVTDNKTQEKASKTELPEVEDKPKEPVVEESKTEVLEETETEAEETSEKKTKKSKK